MTRIRRRRNRPPVFSRLTVAWSAFACAGAALAVYAGIAGRIADDPKIALAVEGAPQMLAQPEQTASVDEPERPALRVAAGGSLPDGPKIIRPSPVSAGAPKRITEDVFAGVQTRLSATANEAFPGEEEAGEAFGASDEIVITIDGSPARTVRKPAATRAAALHEFPAGAPVQAPVPSLMKKTVHGAVPAVSGSGRRASSAYAKPFDAPTDKPIVSLVVAGLGLNEALTEQAIEDLPPNVTLAFAPYAKNLDRWAKRARAAGHELVLELPMEAHRGAPEALGPAALLSTRSEAENAERLQWLLARLEGYFAATNYLGGKFSADRDALRPVLTRLRDAGLAYIDDTGAARRAGVAGEWLSVDRLVAAGGGDDAADARRDLNAVEKIAKRDGTALAKAYAQEDTIGALIEWTREVEKRGFVVAPASAVLRESGPVY